ncbi:MAG TPA: hypothetical protein P5317_10760 [Myxococcota bacterium]|nr:hypothetical protein [Myxococcota bacterium]HRR74840.1 hypothetical protein [Myxococcota bacterium]HRV18474.1 hypothetical protein [Myxococcota bacterium]
MRPRIFLEGDNLVMQFDYTKKRVEKLKEIGATAKKLPDNTWVWRCHTEKASAIKRIFPQARWLGDAAKYGPKHRGGAPVKKRWRPPEPEPRGNHGINYFLYDLWRTQRLALSLQGNKIVIRGPEEPSPVLMEYINGKRREIIDYLIENSFE